MKKPFIIHVHLEKCAGTTLNFLLANNFPGMVYPSAIPDTNQPNTIFTEKHLKKLIQFLPLTQGISGHNIRPFINYENVLNRNIFLFTFFREPISRYMSHFNYQRLGMKIDWTLQEFINYEEFHNFQTTKIAGESNIEKAKYLVNNRLNSFGILEYFDQSLALLTSQLGFDLNLYYYKRNQTNSITKPQIKPVTFSELSPKYKDQIIEVNKLDIELYNYCLEIFNKKYFNNFDQTVSQSIELESKSKRKVVFYFSMLLKKLYRFFIEPIILGEYLAKRKK